MFKEMLKKHGIKHTLTPKYSPQANASERVNRTVLSAIRSYLKPYLHKDWDNHIHEIASALRNVVHSSTQYSPHFLVFGEHKLNHGSEYDVLRLLNFDDDNNLSLCSKTDRLNMVREDVIKHLKEAHSKNSNRYNLRSRVRKFEPGQTVYIRNFTLSDKSKDYSAKLAPKFLKAIISRPIGTVSYEIMNDKNKILGVYHLNDIKNA